MPYKVYKVGVQYCVHKENPDGSRGKKIACHATRAKALAQQRALYANEKKEMEKMASNNLTLELSDDFVEAIDDAKKEVEELVGSAPIGIIGFTEAIQAYYDLVDLGVIDEESDEIADKKELNDELYYKAVWTTAYKNNLPDSAFLYIKPNCGSKDSEGKTKPRSCRKFPVKDASGKYDAAHVRNAVARIPQSKGVPAEKKKSLQARAQAILKKLNKEEDMPTEEKSIANEVSGYVPWGVYSFADLEKAQGARAEALRIKALSDQFVDIVSNIMASEDISDKSAAVTSLSSEYSRLINQKPADTKDNKSAWLEGVVSVVKDTMDNIFNRKKEQATGFMVWKEGNQLKWLARYSNKFRDNDSPPEIISSDSHRRFVDMVDKKEAPMPELWLWHVPEWKLGEASWLAYDDSGFALASGTIDRGKEIVAEQIAKQKLVGVSHGMPVSSIKRDPDDPTIIVEHTSAEISPLPYESAANKMAAWVLLGDTTKEGNNMPIPERKKQSLVDDWNMDPALLEQLEQINARDAEKATEEGIESKEVDAEEEVPEAEQEEKEEVATEEQEEETVEEEATTEEEPAAEESDTTPTDNPPSREEIADAIATVLKPYVELANELSERVKSLEKSDEEKVAKAAALTPSASVSALLAQRFSTIGDSIAEIDGRTSLAKSKPKEEKVEPTNPTPIPFINDMLFGSGESED